MIRFRELSLEDKENLDKLFYCVEIPHVDLVFNNIFIYKDAYKYKICRTHGCYILSVLIESKLCFEVPFGNGDRIAATKELIDYCHRMNIELQFVFATNDEIAFLEESFPHLFEIEETSESSDYILSCEGCATYAGEKFSDKRADCNKFESRYRYTTEKIDSSLIPKCIEITNSWYKEKEVTELNGSLKSEASAINILFKNYEKLQEIGIILYVDDDPVGFIAGSFASKYCFEVHFLKALKSYKGSSSILTRLLAAQLLKDFSDTKYINFEDDSGIAGLRYTKQKYNPIFLMKKYNAKLLDSY